MIAPKLPAATLFPVGSKATERTARVVPASIRVAVPAATSHSLTLVSSLPLASIFPSGLKATERTGAVWPASACPSAEATAEPAAAVPLVGAFVGRAAGEPAAGVFRAAPGRCVAAALATRAVPVTEPAGAVAFVAEALAAV